MAGNIGESTTHESAKRIGVVGNLYTATLSGNLTLDASYGTIFKLDPGGSSRDVLLPAEVDYRGCEVLIINAADAAENLVIKDDSGTTALVTINQNEAARLFCDGTTWTLLHVQTIALT